MKTVLGIVSSRDTETFELLAAALDARGARLVRLDSDRYPTAARLDAELGPGGWRGRLTNHLGETVALADLSAIWWRRLYVGRRIPSEGLHPRVRRACRLEADAALQGILASLPCVHVDDPFAVARAENKPWQLEMARRAGLEVPVTFNSNTPDAVRRWVRSTGPVITKMLAAIDVPTDDGEGVVGTSALTEADLEDLDGLSLAPGTFQGRIEKDLEVRAAVVGDRVLAAGVDSQQLPEAQVDWRKGSETLMPLFRAVALPEGVQRALVRLNRSMGLNYGGADLIRTPEGRWVFLEINPGGEWRWVQEAAGLDVAGALAERLLTEPSA
ncbi:MAG: MvdD family ATP-grasp ribosomal peptide maturase [Alphaproteobacteria bacterium]|nr:MvdD family ATP-grasp ribosomal peptide maturase [Alphaproteobacteria bacterium]